MDREQTFDRWVRRFFDGVLLDNKKRPHLSRVSCEMMELLADMGEEKGYSADPEGQTEAELFRRMYDGVQYAACRFEAQETVLELMPKLRRARQEARRAYTGG